MAAGDILQSGDSGREQAFVEVATAASSVAPSGGIAKAPLVITRPDVSAAAAAAAGMTTQADGTRVAQVDSVMSRFADNFSGAAYAAGAASLAALGTNWNVVRQTLVGMTVTLNNGSLVVNMGTTNSDELLLVGRNIITIPANLIVTFLMSQRIANNEVRFGYCEVDATGALVADANLANFPNNMAAILLNGATATTATLETIANAMAAQKTQAVANMTTTAAICDYSLECRPEDVSMMSQVGDSSTARSAALGRLSSVVPDPGKRYAPFIWIRNTGVPGSATTVTINRFLSADIQELQAEIVGRGSNAASQGVPVNIIGTPPVAPSAQPTVVIGQTVPTIAAGATSGVVDSPSKFLSAATTNATSVKGSAGRLFAGTIRNTHATNAFYVKLFNKATAPTVGTDTPIMTFLVKPGETWNVVDVFGIYGHSFSLGIGLAITGAYTDLDTTAIGAGDAIVNLISI